MKKTKILYIWDKTVLLSTSCAKIYTEKDSIKILKIFG